MTVVERDVLRNQIDEGARAEQLLTRAHAAQVRVVGISKWCSVTRQTEVDFVNKLRTLQRVIGTLSSQTPVSSESQLLIDERDESVECLLISAPPANEQLGCRI